MMSKCDFNPVSKFSISPHVFNTVSPREFVVEENIRLVCLLNLTADSGVSQQYADLCFKYQLEERKKLDSITGVCT